MFLFTTIFVVAETAQCGTVSTTSFCETTEYIFMSNCVLFLNVFPLQCRYVLCMPLIVALMLLYITKDLHANSNHINLISLVSTLSQDLGFTIVPLRMMAIDS